jgi:hypothetical protein
MPFPNDRQVLDKSSMFDLDAILSAIETDKAVSDAVNRSGGGAGWDGPPLSDIHEYVGVVDNSKWGKSGAGNDQITLNFRIEAPETVTVNGVEVQAAGRMMGWYLQPDGSAQFLEKFGKTMRFLGVDQAVIREAYAAGGWEGVAAACLGTRLVFTIKNTKDQNTGDNKAWIRYLASAYDPNARLKTNVKPPPGSTSSGSGVDIDSLIEAHKPKADTVPVENEAPAETPVVETPAVTQPTPTAPTLPAGIRLPGT